MYHSLAWQFVDEDVQTALERLNMLADGIAINHWYDVIDARLVEQAVLAYDDFDEQCEACILEIMRQIRFEFAEFEQD